MFDQFDEYQKFVLSIALQKFAEDQSKTDDVRQIAYEMLWDLEGMVQEND